MNKVDLSTAKVGDMVELSDGRVVPIVDLAYVPHSDAPHGVTLLWQEDHDFSVRIWCTWDGVSNLRHFNNIVAINPSSPKLSHEEVIEDLVIEADGLEKDLEEANVMIDALVMERDGLKRELKLSRATNFSLHDAYLTQVAINKAKQDELDFQSEQLEELLGSESEEKFASNLVVVVSLEDIVGTEDELYDPFKGEY